MKKYIITYTSSDSKGSLIHQKQEFFWKWEAVVNLFFLRHTRGVFVTGFWEEEMEMK